MVRYLVEALLRCHEKHSTYVMLQLALLRSVLGNILSSKWSPRIFELF